ncbi:MAG: hypothetical protein B0D92_03830 [Spirochaeta sp. LUC14_002_19_P3]|nr:MAG: hypothetical protein B0D92_03830 [Spirochaeta sp. LUC14_002_19_P3]
MTIHRAVVYNKDGLHLRPASIIAQAAQQYSCSIWLEKNTFKVDAKSVISILTLDASFQSELQVSAEGKDEKKAAAEITALCEQNFSEMLD